MTSPIIEIQIGASGRVVIPAELRHQLGLTSGDHLVARIDQGRLVLEKPETVKHRLKQRFAHLKDQGVIEELISDRRAAAQKEA